MEKVPGKLKIHISQSQADARDKLFSLYLGTAKREELQPEVHTLLVSLLCFYTGPYKLACPTDYSICLACLEDSDDTVWKFRSASTTTGIFAGMQFCFRMIYFTHCYTIAYNEGSYKPLSPQPLITHTKSTIQTTLQFPSTLSESLESIPILMEVENIRESAPETIELVDNQLSGNEDEDTEIIDDEQDTEIIDDNDRALIQ